MQSPFRASHKRSTEMDSSVPEPRPSTEQGRGQRQQGAEGRGSRGRGRGRGGRRYVARRPRAEAAQPADAQQPQQPQAAAEQRQPQPRGDDVQKQQRQQQQRRRRQRGPKAKQTAGGAAAQAQQEEEDIGDFCFICANPIEYYAIGDCNHLTCSMCALRLRAKLRDRRCAVCKQEKDRVIVAAAANGFKDFAAFGVWSDVGGPGIDTDFETGMMFDHCREHFNELMLMKVPHCPVCKERFPNNAALTAHLAEKHERSMCELCLDNRAIFTNEQEIFTPAGLKKHLKSGQHPLCRFCNRRWFDDHQLYRHMVDAHHTCHLCPVQYQHRYYRDLRALEDHLRSSHFLCEYCNERFVSFATANEYLTHLAAFHNIRRAAPAVNFRVRGARGEGAPAEQESEQESYVDMDVPRRIAQGGQQGSDSEDSQQGAGAQPAAAAGGRRQHGTWARTVGGGNAAPRATEEFPSLPSGPVRTQVENERLAKLRADEERARKRRQELELREQRVKQLIESEQRDLAQQELLERNRRFAEALGLGRTAAQAQGADPLAAYQDELLRPVYTPSLLKFAQESMSKLLRIENQMEKLIRDSTMQSLSLTPMKAPLRNAVQALAKYYNLDSIVYDPEPRRHVCLVKKPESVVPSLLLSDAARQQAAQAAVPPTPVPVDEPVLIFSQLEEGMRGGMLVHKLKELHPDANVVGIRFLNTYSIVCMFPSKQDALETYTVVQRQLQQNFRLHGEPAPFQMTLGFDPSTVEPTRPASDDDLVPTRAEQAEEEELRSNDRWRTGSRDSNEQQAAERAPEEPAGGSRFPHSAVRGRLLPRTLPVENPWPAMPSAETRSTEPRRRPAASHPSRQAEEPQAPENIFAALRDEDDDDEEDDHDWERVERLSDSRVAPDPEHWECPQCTYHNPEHLDRCYECDARRPQPWQFA